MEHFILRCKHCKRTYTYCTYGNGPEYGTEEGCSKEYCATCQKAIDEVLSKINIKFEPRLMEIHEDRLFELFLKLRMEQEERDKNNAFGVQMTELEYSKYDVIETYVHNEKKYKVKWYDDKPDEKHIFIFMEFDLEKNEFTGKPWKFDEKDYYRKQGNMYKNFLLNSNYKKIVQEMKMEEPKGELFYMDYSWDVVRTNEDKMLPKHILDVNSSKASGEHLKHVIKDGWYKTEVKIADDVDTDSIVDFIDYEYTWEKYRDEDVATITKIKCF